MFYFHLRWMNQYAEFILSAFRSRIGSLRAAEDNAEFFLVVGEWSSLCAYIETEGGKVSIVKSLYTPRVRDVNLGVFGEWISTHAPKSRDHKTFYFDNIEKSQNPGSQKF